MCEYPTHDNALKCMSALHRVKVAVIDIQLTRMSKVTKTLNMMPRKDNHAWLVQSWNTMDSPGKTLPPHPPLFQGEARVKPTSGKGMMQRCKNLLSPMD
jgi:hypothetical protein